MVERKSRFYIKMQRVRLLPINTVDYALLEFTQHIRSNKTTKRTISETKQPQYHIHTKFL